jgi:secreted trypsin-like serine protease
MKIFNGLVVLSLLVSALFLGACAKSNGPSGLTNDGAVGIVGGSAVMAGSLVSRSVVAIYGPKFGLCSGTLISGNAVLTAAHCVPTEPGVQLYVIFNVTIKGASPANSRPVVKMYANPRWGTSNTGKDNGDLAVMKFSGSLPPGYAPAKFLPTPGLVANGVAVMLSGYGVTDGVADTGAGVLRNTTTTITDVHFSQTEVLLDQRNGRGTCSGDSGGPAFLVSSGVYYLWGVVSRGDKDCKATGIYTNALDYLPWINQILQTY